MPVKTFNYSVEINRPIEQVFAYVADQENGPKWERPLLEVKRLSGDGGNGTRYAFKRKVPPGMTIKGETSISNYEKNKGLRLTGNKMGGVQPIVNFSFTSKDPGTTVLTLNMPFNLSWFMLLPPMSIFFNSDMQKTPEYLQGLKQMLEAKK